MFSHLTIGTNNSERATAFYDAVLAPLGIERIPSKYEKWAAWQRPGEAPKLWVGFAYNGLPASWGNGWMAAFTAPSRAAVDAAYAAAMAGLRPQFVPNYYAAYVRDPDGNKIHFICRAEYLPQPVPKSSGSLPYPP
jgi:catechol 2,3-dioxygenase-like lactoylglutathione lyase family enzyme